MHEISEIGLFCLCLLCILLGVVVGLSISRAVIRRHEKAEAPAPMLDMGYDPENPINGGGMLRPVGETDPATGLIRIW